jgi:hypothetical protein
MAAINAIESNDITATNGMTIFVEFIMVILKFANPYKINFRNDIFFEERYPRTC